MPRWPLTGPVVPPVLSPWFSYPFDRAACSVSTNQSAAWTANRAYYLPVYIPEVCKITKLWWQNGTVVNGNVDCGVYDDQRNLIISTGSTAQAGASAIQSVDITDTVLRPGLLYFALASDSSTATFWTTNDGPDLYLLFSGFFNTTAFPLPNPATFTEVTNGVLFPWKYGALVAPRTVL